MAVDKMMTPTTKFIIGFISIFINEVKSGLKVCSPTINRTQIVVENKSSKKERKLIAKVYRFTVKIITFTKMVKQAASAKSGRKFKRAVWLKIGMRSCPTM